MYDYKEDILLYFKIVRYFIMCENTGLTHPILHWFDGTDSLPFVLTGSMRCDAREYRSGDRKRHNR